VDVYQPPCLSIRVRQNLRNRKENPCGKKAGLKGKAAGRGESNMVDVLTATSCLNIPSAPKAYGDV
jgi:hypothetical protein